MWKATRSMTVVRRMAMRARYCGRQRQRCRRLLCSRPVSRLVRSICRRTITTPHLMNKDTSDHHDEQQFHAVKLRATLRYVAHYLSLHAFCADAPRKVSQRRRPSRRSTFMRQFGARSSGWVCPSVRSSAGSGSRTRQASSIAPRLQGL